MLALGVVEVGYALLDQHVVTKLTREGSNLISRDTTLQDAATAMRSMSSRPVDFDDGSRLIFSVLKKGATTGTSNYDQIILYQRYEYGSLPGVEQALTTRGQRSFGGAPDYEAANSDTDTSLRITNLPANWSGARGGLIYVTEIYTRHHADHAARPVRGRRCRTRSIRSPTSSTGVCTRHPAEGERT